MSDSIEEPNCCSEEGFFEDVSPSTAAASLMELYKVIKSDESWLPDKKLADIITCYNLAVFIKKSEIHCQSASTLHISHLVLLIR